MHLIFIRHGDPDYKNDTLTAKGMQEALLLGERIRKWNVTDFYVSPFGRAQKTAEISMKTLSRQPQTLPWLREFNYTIKDPRTGSNRIAWDWLPRDFFDESLYFDRLHWMDTNAMKSGNIGSYDKAVCDGIDAVLSKYDYNRLSHEKPIYKCTPHLSVEQAHEDTHLNAYQPPLDDRTIVFFCHLGVMFAMIAHLTGISPVQLWQGFFVAPTSVTVLGAEERIPGEVIFRVSCMGDCSHLTVGKEPPSASGFFGNCFSY